MRPFLIALIIIVPLLLTFAALGRVNAGSRRYAKAESELIDALQRDEKRSNLSELEAVVASFLDGSGDDPVQLAGAIKFITVEAGRLNRNSPIIRILRHGSDHSKARYLEMLFSEIPPPPPEPPYKHDNPNQPPPSSTARKPKSSTARKTPSQGRVRSRAAG